MGVGPCFAQILDAALDLEPHEREQIAGDLSLSLEEGHDQASIGKAWDPARIASLIGLDFGHDHIEAFQLGYARELAIAGYEGPVRPLSGQHQRGRQLQGVGRAHGVHGLDALRAERPSTSVQATARASRRFPACSAAVRSMVPARTSRQIAETISTRDNAQTAIARSVRKRLRHAGLLASSTISGTMADESQKRT
jgi:hypothetical protein